MFRVQSWWGMKKVLEQSLVQMPFTRIETKTFTLSSGLKSVIIPNVVNGILPSRMILGLVSNSTFNGNFQKNPFNFKNYNLSYISLSENGVQIPMKNHSHSHTSREIISLCEESLEDLVGRALTYLKLLFTNVFINSRSISFSLISTLFILTCLPDSVRHKTINKRLTRSESESDVESINDEDERNSLFGKNRKPWSLPTSSPGAIESPGALNQHEKYDVVITDDLRLAEEIPLLSVYVGEGFAVEIKTFHVVLLAEVFENFRTLSMNYFELDPVHFYTTPSLTWNAGIKTTNVTLELLTDINMYLMLESGIRGGMCLVSKRYSKANNKYLDNFDEMSPSKFIISLDVNNLYGTAMGFYSLPESEFRFLNEEEIDKFDLMSVTSDSNTGYILK
ncbi:vesicular glutamate transporter 2 [Trichonephila clavipes]|nr:vesicular glutamate transporter 2 [Trichonephila clavipes]